MNPADIFVLQATDLPAPAEAALKSHFNIHRIPDEPRALQDFLGHHGGKVRAIAGSGKGKVDEALLTALPNLEIISVTSAGLDNIDTEAAARRGIRISNTSSVLADDVADLALWLALGTTRQLVQADGYVRRGEWTDTNSFPVGRTISGMRIGIIGLGHIGKATARRLQVIGGELAYTGRSKQPGVEYRYFDDVNALAEWSEMLVVSCPYTPETHHLVDKSVIEALGPSGVLINIARGAIVDEQALTDALSSGALLSAGLDVFEFEPKVPAALVDNDRTVVLPHIGSATDATRRRMWQHMVEVLLAHFDLPAVVWGTVAA